MWLESAATGSGDVVGRQRGQRGQISGVLRALERGGSGPDTDILTKLRRLLSEDRLWGDKSGGRGMTWEAKDDGGLGCRMLARDVEGLTVSISLPNSWSD